MASGAVDLDVDVELKLFGCAIPFYAERSSERGIVLEEATTRAGICIEEPICISDRGRGKAPKEGVSATENTQPSHILPEDGSGEEEIPTGGATIIFDNNNNDHDNNNNGNNRLMKKPKKLRPCPRCKSLNTKFCYFNNGNANQPRHFCRGCQRYWTAGGTLRNVPVGSGRRKSKVSSSSSSTTTTTTTSLTHHHALPHPLVKRIDGASVRSDIDDSAQYLPPQSTVLPTAVISRCLQMGCSIQDRTKMSKSSSSYGVMEDSIGTMMPMDEQSAVNGEEGCWATINALNERDGFINGSSGETYPPIDEYTCSSSEQASTAGGGAGRDFMGNSPPFGCPMQPWPYGYGLFGFSSTLNYNQSPLAPPLAAWCIPPWMGAGGCLPWPLMPAIPPWPHWGVPPWAITTPMMGSYNTPPCSSSLDLGKHPTTGKDG